MGLAGRRGGGATTAHAGEPPENGDLSDIGWDRLSTADRGAGQTRQDLQPGELQGACCCSLLLLLLLSVLGAGDAVSLVGCGV